MKRLLIIAGAALALAGCDEKKPIDTIRSGNPQVSAQLMAVVEGCGVYRLGFDRWVYTTICPNHRRASSEWTESCGKSCSREVSVDTVTRNDD